MKELVQKCQLIQEVHSETQAKLEAKSGVCEHTGLLMPTYVATWWYRYLCTLAN